MPTIIPSSISMGQSRSRNVEKRRDGDFDLAWKRAKLFLRFAQVIRVPYTLESLAESKVSKSELEEICDELDDQPAQCMSGQWIGEDGTPLLFYFGRRIIVPRGEPPVRLKP